MEAGMGIHQGHALGEAGGAALGRAVNIGADTERMVSNMPMPQPAAVGAPNAGMFPGYPQDMFVLMDELVAKPETHGLRPGWTAGTMGMMTIIRVITPELFDTIEALKAERAKAAAR
jgi:hypothetical protein